MSDNDKIESLYDSELCYQINLENEKAVLAKSYAGAGLSITSLLGISFLTDRHQELVWASYFFATALPLLWASSLISTHVLRATWSTPSTRSLAMTFRWLGYTSVWLGLVLIARHIHYSCGMILFASGVLLMLGWWLGGRSYDRTCAQLNRLIRERSANVGDLPTSTQSTKDVLSAIEEYKQQQKEDQEGCH